MRRQRRTKDRPATGERTVTACRRCRQRKVKCSGVAPCRNCANQRQPCIFDEADRRIVVSERHLRDLEHRARLPSRLENHRDSVRERADPNYESPRIDDRSSVLSSNLESSDVTQAPTQKRRHSLVWDFSQQIKKILGVELSENSSRSSSYKVPLHDEAFLDSLESAFPPKNYIIHLAHVADFHVNANLCLFSITSFIDQLNKATLNTISNTFKVKLSLIIALGRLFLEKGATVSGPPGIKDFLKAVHDFQPHAMVDEDPFLAMECLCLLATYALAADMHRMAYLYIGQAARIARAWKFDCNDGDTEPGATKHVQELWLSVCTLDQRLSASVGVSPDTGCEEHSILNSQLNNASNVEIRLNLAISNILTRVVKVLRQHRIEGALASSFADTISTELVNLQSLVERLKSIAPLCSTSSLSTTSRQVATLHLHFYHCIMVATRPTLLCLLKFGLQEPGSIPENAPDEALLKIIQTCINAANCALSIISTLHEQNLLEKFMILDKDITFEASLCLMIANKICPNATEPYYIPLADNMLQYMSDAGSIPAGLLQKELNSLHGLITDHEIPSFHQRFGRNSSFSIDNNFLDKRIGIIQNGLDLSNAVFHVIETESPNDFITANAPESSIEVATRKGNINNSIPPQSFHEFQMDGIDPADTSFSFDMADLQWLDCVQ